MSKETISEADYKARIEELENRLQDAEHLIDAIKSGEVDAFAFSRGTEEPEIFTLQSGDFAYRILVENINEGALNLSEDKLIVYTNSSFCELLGLSYDQVIGRRITEFLDPTQHTLFQQIFQQALTGESKAELTLSAGEVNVPVYISLKSLQPQLATVGMIVTNLTAHKKAEKDAEIKDSLQNIFKQSPAAIAITEGLAFEFVSANDHFLTLFAITAQELIGKNLEEVFPSAAATGILHLFQQTYATNEPVVIKARELLLKNDRTGKTEFRYFDSVLQPIKNDAGLIISVMIHMVEVTEQVTARKKIEESETALNELANAVPQLVWMADADGQVLYYNNRINEFSGAAKTLEGRWNWDKLLHSNDLIATQATWEAAVRNKNVYEREHRIRLKDGSYRWFLSRGYPQKDNEGNVIKWYGSATDIHSQKMHEAQKDEFLKMVSHELKTPVTSIKGYVQLLLAMMEGEDGKVAQLVKPPLTRIDNQIGRLGKLITDLLDISRLEDGKMDLQMEEVVLETLITETIQDILLAHPSHEISFNCSFPVTIAADKNRIGQVLINLINNAIKYSPNQQKIEVNQFASIPGFISISIRDFGIGIEESEQEKIFHRFYQAEETVARNYTGFGIGLYITAEIIQRHGGHILVESKKDEGSLFTFNLPLKS